MRCVEKKIHEDENYSVIEGRLRDLPIRIRSFGGPLIWWVRKNYSDLTSRIMLSFVEKVRRNKIQAYIVNFLSAKATPSFRFLMLETLNRCNGTCSFCPAAGGVDKRPYKKMEEALFDKIITELVEKNWVGSIFLQVNNEPLLDKRWDRFAKSIRDRLPQCRICIITNGTLLDVDKLKSMIHLVDELIINDYGETYKLSPHIKELYSYVQHHGIEFRNVEIVISRRYRKEILATRAGAAPNKPHKNNNVNSPCIYPFTDMIVFPDGKVGMCCNDCFEVTAFGDLNTENIFDVWENDRFKELRKCMSQGRDAYPFCIECDVVDAGSREKVILRTRAYCVNMKTSRAHFIREEERTNGS